MLIFFQALSTKGWQDDPCLIRTAGERLLFPHGSTGKERSFFLWQFSWANRRLEGRASSTSYIRTRSPRSCAREGETNMWYVGLDWADTHHDVEVLDEAGKRVGVRRFVHNHEGLNELKAFLLGIAASPEELACIVETNHGLLITFLLEAGIPVYPVNPKSTNQLRKAPGANTDQIDP